MLNQKHNISNSAKPNWKKPLIFLLFILSIILISVAVVNPILNLRYKLLAIAVILLALNIAVFLISHWKKRKIQGVLMGIFSLFMSFIIIFTAFFWPSFINLVYNYDDDFPTSMEDLAVSEKITEDIINVALFGVDTRKLNSFSGNSDSIMILSIDKSDSEIKIISIMRDSLVPVDKNGTVTYGKINSAYAKGGPELAVRTLNKNFGLDITEYATVNFYGMANIIDVVGGIEVELTDREVFDKNGHSINSAINSLAHTFGVDAKENRITESGIQHLNGLQAVAYSRMRHLPTIWGTNNDYGRTDRQRYVMEQLFNKVLDMNKSSLPALVRAIQPYMITSLEPDEIFNYSKTIIANNPSFKQARIPQTEYLMQRPTGSFGAVVYYDLEFATNLIHSYIYEDISFEDYINANGISKNDWYASR